MIDEFEFAETVRNHLREWQSAACRITGNVSDADDVIQDALISAWDGREVFTGQSKFSTFIYGIVVHKACDLVKSEAARSRRHKNWTMPASRPRNDILYEAIAKLPPADGRAIIALLENEMDYSKTAKLLDCPESTLYRHIQRIKASLKVLIRELQ